MRRLEMLVLLMYISCVSKSPAPLPTCNALGCPGPLLCSSTTRCVCHGMACAR